jgi:hypothetical protein
MSTKEKAIELCQKMYDMQYRSISHAGKKKAAKFCAMVAVDEIIKCGLDNLTNAKEPMGYWQKVKEEIEKL